MTGRRSVRGPMGLVVWARRATRRTMRPVDAPRMSIGDL